MSATRVYEFYKNKWETTKPIRGRSEEVKPLGQRRRDWEKVTRKDIGNGQYSYCAKLYNTECVEYLPDGSIKLRIEGWVTPSTAEFIHEHSPFVCFKRNNKLWVEVRENAGEVKVYPLGETDLHLLAVDDGRWYRPAEPVVIKKFVVNRDKAKEARACVMPFIEWAKLMLKISDGWVMHETMKQVFGWENKVITGCLNEQHPEYVNPYMRKDKDMLRLCQSENDDDRLLALCLMAKSLNDIERRKAESFSYETEWNNHKFQRTADFYDYRMNMDTIKRYVYKLVEKVSEIHDIVEVEATNKTMTGVV
jgi:hypothetical protein